MQSDGRNSRAGVSPASWKKFGQITIQLWRDSLTYLDLTDHICE